MNAPPPTSPRGRLLNCDDNEASRYAKTRVLRAAGYEVMEAGTGGDALRMVVEDKPDLVLMDVKLPDMSGLEVCRRIKSNPLTAWTLVIQNSASFVGQEDQVRGLEGGADTYLTAPIEPTVLVATVNALMRLGAAERGLRESQGRLKLALVASGTGTFRWDPATDAFIDVDEDLRALLELGAGESMNATADLIARAHEEDRAHIACAMEACKQGGDCRFEFRIVRPDGTMRWLAAKAQLHSVRPGNARQLMGACTDITMRKLIEREREALLQSERRARATAEQANRMKDEFVATLSHELRTPLNAIIGWSEILKGKATDAETMTAGLEAIGRNSRLQAQLIEDLLDVSRILSGKLRLDIQAVNAGAVAEAAAAAVHPAAEAKSITVKQEVQTGLPTMAADPTRLQQIIWNLLSNAIKFTPRGGRVKMTVARTGDDVRISVADTGMGIEPDFLPHVFERFRQADASTTRRFGGLGLGLSIVKSLTELHGGTIDAASEGEGHGATFVVTLPIKAPPAASASLTPARERTRTPSKRAEGVRLDGVRVLAVDDDESTRELLLRLFRDRGAPVVVASSAAEAMARIKEAPPDVLISDIGMPDADGFTLIREIRALPKEAGGEIPAVALTALARAEDQQRALEAGYQVHVAKPADPDHLIGVVAELAGRTA